MTYFRRLIAVAAAAAALVLSPVAGSAAFLDLNPNAATNLVPGFTHQYAEPEFAGTQGANTLFFDLVSPVTQPGQVGSFTIGFGFPGVTVNSGIVTGGNVSLVGPGGPVVPDIFSQGLGAVVATYLNVPFSAGDIFRLTIDWNQFQTGPVNVEVQATVIPLPAAGLLLIGGLAALGMARASRARSARAAA